MELKGLPRLSGLLFVLLVLTKAQEDSLRSALNAVDRRQKDLTDYAHYGDDNDYGYSLNGPDDLEFLTPTDYNSEFEIDKNPALQRLLLEYLGSPSLQSGRVNRIDDVKKRISSSFRERLEEDKERQLEELADNVLANPDNDQDNDEYNERMRELWDKYKNYPSVYRPRTYNDDIRKRSHYYYPKFGLDSAGLRKRNYYEPEETPYLYDTRDDFFDRYQDEDTRDIDSVYNDWNKNRHNKRERQHDSQQRSNNYPSKRFPVSKRSSNFAEITHEHKRSTLKKDSPTKTDPKVAKDLSNIFGALTTEKPATTGKPSKTNKPSKKEPTKIKTKVNKAKPSKSKEEFSGVGNEKPLQIKKKSIDWSDYFGLDRRKKSEDDLDKEWLLERYHKAIALTSKRTADYPLQSFKNHDQLSKKESTVNSGKKHLSPEDVKISEMDAKLKSMEDTIIDDALKYTGAHEGSMDSQEIQEVKDRVISRLAAAYSLEKMRRALGEYKLSMAKDKDRQKQEHRNSDDYEIAEEKRVSVPRKQAVDEDSDKIPETDNSIKCAQGDEDCDEMSYRAPPDLLEQAAFKECPKVQRACSQVATVLGHYAKVFETACNMHQMCLLCSNNSWFAPTRQCNVLFLTKAFELCDGKQECQKEAQRSVRYLLDVNRSLRLESLGECEMVCPDRR